MGLDYGNPSTDSIILQIMTVLQYTRAEPCRLKVPKPAWVSDSNEEPPQQTTRKRLKVPRMQLHWYSAVDFNL